MTDQEIINLYTVFRTLPPEVKDWLTSEGASKAIGDIARQFVLSDNQELEIPFLVVRLVTQNIPPDQFVGELARAVSLDLALAQKITDAIMKDVLAPIEKPLRFTGIDLDRLEFAAPASPIKSQIPNPKSQINSNNQNPKQSSQPFILHEEPGFKPPPAGGPSITFTQPSSFNPSTGTAPPKVIIERVVHYSPLYTPLNQVSVQKFIPEKKVGIPKSKWFI